jgi:hypothetical protein
MLGFEVLEQPQQVPLERVRAALAVVVVVLPEIPVQQGRIQRGEIAVESAGAEPCVQIAGRVHVGVDRCLLVMPFIAVRRGPQVVGEFGDRGLADTEVDLPGCGPGGGPGPSRPGRRGGVRALEDLGGGLAGPGSGSCRHDVLPSVTGELGHFLSVMISDLAPRCLTRSRARRRRDVPLSHQEPVP